MQKNTWRFNLKNELLTKPLMPITSHFRESQSRTIPIVSFFKSHVLVNFQKHPNLTMSPPQDLNPKLPQGYCDLNLPYEPVNTIQARIIRAISLGYQTIAVSVSVHQDELTFKSRKHKAAKKAKLDPEHDKPDQMTDFPEPPKITIKPEDHLGWPAPVILTRLTLTVNDNNFQPIWNSSETGKKYDLVAICPTSASTLTNILKSAFRADIIAFDPVNVRDVRWTRKLYNECVSQLMFFEINYAPCIRDTSTRRTTISQSHNYHLYGKSKAIFMSSGATNVLEMRGPHDVANLGFLFGLNEHQGKLAVKSLGHQVVKTALGRKLGPFRALIQKVDQLPDDEKWKVPQEESDQSDESNDEDEGEIDEKQCKKNKDDFIKL